MRGKSVLGQQSENLNSSPATNCVTLSKLFPFSDAQGPHP